MDTPVVGWALETEVSSWRWLVGFSWLLVGFNFLCCLFGFGWLWLAFYGFLFVGSLMFIGSKVRICSVADALMLMRFSGVDPAEASCTTG